MITICRRPGSLDRCGQEEESSIAGLGARLVTIVAFPECET